MPRLREATIADVDAVAAVLAASFQDETADAVPVHAMMRPEGASP
jgi:hypothetical protein